jgi:hypothetical protein
MERRGLGLRVTCDLGAAYPQELGVKLLQRELEWDGRGGLRVSDALEADAPRALSVLIHADREPRRAGPRHFSIDAGDVALDVRVENGGVVDAKIEPQWVIAQGRPGSVELGEREQRGYRLTLTAPPARSARLVVSLKVSEGEK